MNNLKACPFCGEIPVANGDCVVRHYNRKCPAWGICDFDIWNTRPFEEALTARTEALEAKVERLRGLMKSIYEPARIASSQIICLGGGETCQPCENREHLLEVLAEMETELKGGEK